MHTIETVAQAYIAQNPAEPFAFHGVSTDGFRQEEGDGRYRMDLLEKFPDAPLGAYCYVMAKVVLDAPVRQLSMAVNCFGPVTVYLGGSEVYRSQCLEEVRRDIKKLFSIPLPAGESLFVIKLRRVASGFGCIFGAEADLANPKRYQQPFVGREGLMGFVYSAPVMKELVPDELPQAGVLESELCWYPQLDWTGPEAKEKQMTRMYGIQEGAYGYGLTRFETGACAGEELCCLRGEAVSPCTFFLDGVWIGGCEPGPVEVPFSAVCGNHSLAVECRCKSGRFGYTIDIYGENGALCETFSPLNVKGARDSWVYLGPLTAPIEDKCLSEPFKVYEDRYWRLDQPGLAVRPYLEASRFGRWNYPLGVTLYGLYRAAKLLDRQDISTYVRGHMKLCAAAYDYALWDREKYGYPTLDPKLVNRKMLDDCGSCGSAMLELYLEEPDPEFLKIAKLTADFIMYQVERREDGALYRLQHGVHYQTMWADDLYMSTPFLARYSQVTGDLDYIREAAKQFRLFKKYLYMEEAGLMSHVYNFEYKMQNGQPWGRGNGWVLFSLTEVIERMPADLPEREELITFFRQLSQGILRVQGENGLWHQLLTDDTSYEETSCSAMFLYGFARGIRLGLFLEEEKQVYYKAVCRAWRGLEERAVDWRGNVYGVCWGSQYSFQPEYYTQKLLWAKNDTHGIGIVLLAGVEYALLQEWLRKDGKQDENH